MTKILAFLIISCSTYAQNIHLELWLRDGYYKYQDYAIKAPWQSVRYIDYQSLQIDIRGSLEEISKIDLMKVKRDLHRLYSCNKYLELFEDFEELDYHTSGKGRLYAIASYEEAFIKDKTKWPSVGNWEFGYLPNTDLAYGFLKLRPDYYQISFPLFLKDPILYVDDDFYHIIDKLPDTITIPKK